MKKVLFVATVVKTHIMQFHTPYLKMLKQMGWQTAVAARNDYENPEDCHIPYCDAYYDIPFERMPWKVGNIRSYRMLKDLICRENFDVIHCHTPVGAMIARLAAAGARKRGTRVVYTAHGFHFFTGAPWINWLLFYPAEWLLAPLTDVLITINREDYLRAKKSLRAKQVLYVPGVGVATEKFGRCAVEPEEKRRQLGFRQEDFLVLTVAEMTKNKNHATILRGLALLKDEPEFSGLQYLICGRGEEWGNLEALAAELGISDHVHFLGYRSDAPELYGCSDLFLFMPFREGLSLALMEAMSSGLPTICTKIRGNTDLIEDGISGVFAENTPEAVAEAVLALRRDPERRKVLGAQAVQKVRHFDEAPVHARMKEIYQSL